MKNIFIFFIFFLCSVPQALSQEVAFNNFYPIDMVGASRMQHLVVTDDTIVGLIQGQIEEASGQWGVIVAKFDSSGVLLDHAFVWDDSLFHWYLVSDTYHNIIRTDDGGYAFTCSVSGRLSALLVKLDHDLNLEFIKEYNGGEFSRVAFAVHETETGYVISGSLENTEEKVVPFVWHVDKQGEIIWEKYYGEGVSFSNGRISDVAVSDGQIYAIGHYSSPQRTFIEVLDMNGEVLRSWVSGANPEEGRLKRIVDVVGQDLITYGWYYEEIINGVPYIRPNFFRFGEDLEIEWTHRMEFVTIAGQDNDFNRFTKTQDGHYLAIGMRRHDFGGVGGWSSGGWLHQFSPLGDSLWSGHIEIPEPGDFTDGYFGGGGVLSSGNIICGGSFIQGPQSYPWLVKLNCSDTLFCGEPFVSSTAEVREHFAISVSPNPATEQLSVAFSPSAKYERLRIFDLNGREVMERPLTGAEVELTIGHLPAGLYLLRVEGESGSASTKFVKE